MKIRTAFVSNSSSSSFMIVEPDDGKLTVTIDITPAIEKRIETHQALVRYLNELYWKDAWKEGRAETEPQAVKEYQRLNALLQQGKKICIISGSNEDYTLAKAAVYNMNQADLEKGGITVIERWP